MYTTKDRNKTKQNKKKHTVKTTVRVYLIVEIKPPISDSPEMSLLRRWNNYLTGHVLFKWRV